MRFFATLPAATFVVLLSCSFFSGRSAGTAHRACLFPQVKDTSFKEVKPDGGYYQLSVPKYMEATTSLNDQASLQYQNIYKELYILVIDEPKSDFIQTFKAYGEYNDSLSVERNYRVVQMKTMAEKLEIKGTPRVSATNINGQGAEIVSFSAYAEDVVERIYYKFAFIDGKDKMYMIMTWTLDGSRMVYDAVMTSMLTSFRLPGQQAEVKAPDKTVSIEISRTKKASLDVTVAHQYQMTIPDHLKATTSLNDEASLQYQDIYKELYIIVIDEPKPEFINTFKALNEYNDSLSAERNYRISQMKSISETATIKGTPVIREVRINGLEAETVEFTGFSEGIADPIYYKFAFVDGKDNMYMIMTWTLEESKEKNKAEMDAMLNSFRLQQATR